ncbi:hypothetical protein [Streptomyces sp. CBMA123]|uniref:hypothetical protein n=1 Tax=Streptomyces sp. CBMA123 TaxID=1896313 RepID=UPI0016621B53|nr:hypothetical protein [Streptomyces sp. CBMA123]
MSCPPIPGEAPPPGPGVSPGATGPTCLPTAYATTNTTTSSRTNPTSTLNGRTPGDFALTPHQSDGRNGWFPPSPDSHVRPPVPAASGFPRPAAAPADFAVRCPADSVGVGSVEIPARPGRDFRFTVHTSDPSIHWGINALQIRPAH